MALPDTFGRQAYSVEQAAAVLGISRRTAFRHVASGALCTTKLGRRRLVPASELVRLLSSGEPARPISDEQPQSPARTIGADAVVAAAPALPAERPRLSDLLAQTRSSSVIR